MTTIDNIKDLYGQLNDKEKFILLLCDEFGGSPRAKRNNWFSDSGFWNVPEKKQVRVVEIMQKIIYSQNNA